MSATFSGREEVVCSVQRSPRSGPLLSIWRAAGGGSFASQTYPDSWIRLNSLATESHPSSEHKTTLLSHNPFGYMPAAVRLKTEACRRIEGPMFEALRKTNPSRAIQATHPDAAVACVE